MKFTNFHVLPILFFHLNSKADIGKLADSSDELYNVASRAPY
jgi:hypothetical protein